MTDSDVSGAVHHGVNLAASALRAIVAEDDLLLREGLASLLTGAGFEVVGQARDGGELVALAREKKPELVIADIRMPPTQTTEGLDAAKLIRTELPDTAVMVLSAHIEVEHAAELLAAGRGVGYLLKDRVADVDEFLDGLRRIAKGAAVVDPALVQTLISGRRPDDPLLALSPREYQVLELMAQGLSNTGIARRLWVTEGTVQKHVGNILMKLHLPETDDQHRRVRAVIAYLRSR